MWSEFFSEGARWLYVFVATFVILPLSKWWSKNKQEKKELIDKVDRLEVQVLSVNDKIDNEIEERRTMEAKIDNMSDKIYNKFDDLNEVLKKVEVNTALNSHQLKNK